MCYSHKAHVCVLGHVAIGQPSTAKSSCHPLPSQSQYTNVCPCLYTHMYACDHCDHAHPHNALYSLSTKHMSVYWTRYWSTFHCQHSTQEGGRLEDSTRLQQKGVQLSASHSHYEMCSWQCSTCHPGSSTCRVDRVARRCSSHRCKAKLKRSSTTSTTITALAKTQRLLMSIRRNNQNNSIHPLRKNINLVTMPTRDALLRHLEKRSYTRKDTRLHTLISYVLLIIMMMVVT